MAVATFIVVSGFSLALAPMRDGGTLSGGVKRFLRRRAWRILPAYWAALILSLIIMAVFLQPQLSTGAIGRATAVYGLLLQDAVGSANPNGALWSIAVEWQIYFVFPLILIVGRRTNLVTAVSLTAAVVILVHAATSFGPPFDKLTRLTPQFLALFAAGVLAVWLGRHDRLDKLVRPLGMLAAMAFGTFVALAATQGSLFMVINFFWVVLLCGIGVASMLALMYAGRVNPARRFFGSRGLVFLGLFSYSIYLIHDPIVSMLSAYVFGPMALSPLATFALSLVLGLPLVLAFCYGFHLMFEAPFLRQRHLSAIKTMPLVRFWPQWLERRRARTEAPAEEVPGSTLVPTQPAMGERSAG